MLEFLLQKWDSTGKGNRIAVGTPRSSKFIAPEVINGKIHNSSTFLNITATSASVRSFRN